jgi:hypothetical protein
MQDFEHDQVVCCLCEDFVEEGKPAFTDGVTVLCAECRLYLSTPPPGWGPPGMVH